jgi:copper transport protein
VTGVARRTAFVVAAIAFAIITTAGPAWAHAQLEGTSPSNNSTVPRSPREVSATFGEPVEISLGSIKVYNSLGQLIDTGAPHHAGNSHIVAVSVPHLGDGGYVVTWRVISADSHPVHGAFTFHVGNAGAATQTQRLAARLLASENGGTTVGALFAIARFGVFVALALLLGTGVFLGVIAPWARTGALVRLLWAGWAALLGFTATGILLQGPYGGALPLRDAVRSAVVRAVLHTRFGHVAEVRLALLILAFPVVVALTASRRPSWCLPAGAALGLALAATPGLAGHAATGAWIPFAVAADVIHVAAVSVWLGGLVALVIVLWRRASAAETTVSVTRFSRTAFWCVAALVATGLFQAWRQVGLTWDAYAHTTYGRLLVVKVAMFVVLVAVAAVSRRLVRRRWLPASLSSATTTDLLEPEDRWVDPLKGRRPLLRSVAIEVCLGAAVLAVTALLVNAQPARSALAQPFATELRAENALVDITITPTRAGRNDIHVYLLSKVGTPLYAQDVSVDFTLPAKNIGPLPIRMQRAGPSHFLALHADIPIPGRWRVDARVLRSDVDELVVSTNVTIH